MTMRVIALTITIMSTVFLWAPPCVAASADSPSNTPEVALNAPAQNSTAARCSWSKRKKIATAVVLGCVVATAIAVPVAVSAHHRASIRKANRRRNLAILAIRNQQIVVSREEQSIRSLLGQGPLTMAQQTVLQADLVHVQKSEAFLNLAGNDLAMHKSLGTALMFDKDGVDELAQSHVIARQYDGFADFPMYPINVISDPHLLLGVHP